MIFKCKIVKINDDQITILIHDTEIIGFSNQGVISDVGIETEVKLEFYDDLIFRKNDDYGFIDGTMVQNGKRSGLV